MLTCSLGFVLAVLVTAANVHDKHPLPDLLHGQEDIAAEQERAGVEVIRADIRDGDARRRALSGCSCSVR